MNRYYTYAYLRAEDSAIAKAGTPYYIGKGQGRRRFEVDRHRIPVPKDKARIIILKSGLSDAEAIKHEVYLISVLGRVDLGTGILRNLTAGGEGTSGRVVSEEHKRILSVTHKGKTLSPEHLEALRLSNVGRGKSLEEIKSIQQKLNRAITLKHTSGLLLHFSSRKECWSWLGCSRNVLTRLLNGEQYRYEDFELY